MKGWLVGDEKEKQEKEKGNTPRGTTSSVDGAGLRSWHGEAYLSACGEPVNNDDQQEWRNHQQTLHQLWCSRHNCIIHYVSHKPTNQACACHQEPFLWEAQPWPWSAHWRPHATVKDQCSEHLFVLFCSQMLYYASCLFGFLSVHFQWISLLKITPLQGERKKSDKIIEYMIW